jgi:hypothetical protein
VDSSIVLSDDLLKEYYEFKHNGSYDNETIQNLFNYYKSPHITNVAQLQRIGIADSILFAQLLQSNLTQQTLLGLCDKTTFKVILDKSNSDYPYINIFQDRIENNYSSTFYKRESRLKAQEHIQALLKDADRIFIYDNHLISQWRSSKRFFIDLLPKKRLNIYYTNNQLKQEHKSELRRVCQEWSISEDMTNPQHRDLHDRYLIIDNKIEIILTSGFDYLFDESKDFTYIVREK